MGWLEAVATAEVASVAGMEARLLTEGELSLWDGLVGESPCASVFDESRWLLAASQVMEQPIEIVGVFDGGQLVGGMAITASCCCGMGVATLPPLCPSNSCIIAPRSTTSRGKQERHVLRVTESMASFLRNSFGCVVVTNNPAMTDVRAFRWAGYLTNILYTYHVDLAFADLKRLPEVRRAVQRGAREGVVSDEHPALDDVYGLLELSYRRHGICPPITRDQLAQLCERLPGTVVPRVVKLERTGQPAACVVVARDPVRGVAHALYAGFDHSQRQARAPFCVHWHEMEECRELGFGTYDFVGADVKSNVEFKAEFGGRLVPYYEVTYARLLYRIASPVCGGLTPKRRVSFVPDWLRRWTHGC